MHYLEQTDTKSNHCALFGTNRHINQILVHYLEQTDTKSNHCALFGTNRHINQILVHYLEQTDTKSNPCALFGTNRHINQILVHYLEQTDTKSNSCALFGTDTRSNSALAPGEGLSVQTVRRLSVRSHSAEFVLILLFDTSLLHIFALLQIIAWGISDLKHLA